MLSQSNVNRLGCHGYRTREISRCTAKKRGLWRKLKQNPHNTRIRATYRECAHKLRQLVQDREICLEERIVEANNLGAFYRFVNKRLMNKTGVAAVVDPNGITLSHDQDIADAFNTYFSSVGVQSNNCCPQFPKFTVPKLGSVEFCEQDVVAAINKLKSNLSAGPDGLPPLLFKRIKYAIANPLTLLFKQMLSVASVPEVWKTAIVTPVHKKGPTNVLSNYRPISITCVPCKLLERIVINAIYKHLIDNDILCNDQHGFVRGRSTCTNLLEALNDWTHNVQDNCPTMVIYIDFSKAFDVVQHDKLFLKLRSYGICEVLLNWIINLFSNRTFSTKINDLLSSVANLICGVIQGSVIGPLMFLIYINDLVVLLSRFGVKVKLFADDAKLYVKVVNTLAIDELEKALTALSQWADEWQLSISVSKCCVLCIGKVDAGHQFHINDVPLPIVTSCRDLGITVSSSLFFSEHIKDIVRKAHQRANMIHRCFVSRNVRLLVRAFTVYVRPLLEHNSVIWSPLLKQDIKAVEQVQRRFTKRLQGLRDLPYTERLILLNLQSLEVRRLHFDLILCYRIVFGLVSVNKDDFFQLNNASTRGHPYKLYKPFSHCRARTSFFSIRVVNVWNDLPADIVDFRSLHSFKKTIRTADLSKYLSDTYS